MPKYARTLDELKGKAVLHWPHELIEREASISVLPLLLKTQDKFISILNLSDSSPDSWKKFVDVSEEVKGNLFLKHLMVLSDLGGEASASVLPLLLRTQDKFISVFNLADPGQSLGKHFLTFLKS